MVIDFVASLIEELEEFDVSGLLVGRRRGERLSFRGAVSKASRCHLVALEPMARSLRAPIFLRREQQSPEVLPRGFESCGENRRFILNTLERVKPLTLCNSTYFFSVFYFLYPYITYQCHQRGYPLGDHFLLLALHSNHE